MTTHDNLMLLFASLVHHDAFNLSLMIQDKEVAEHKTAFMVLAYHLFCLPHAHAREVTFECIHQVQPSSASHRCALA